LKKLHGNPRKERLPINEPEGVGDLWAPPAWFNNAQRVQWQYALDHTPPGLLTGTDREVLAVWCVACVEWAKAVREVQSGGQVVETSNGNVVQNPYLSVMNKQALIMLKTGGEMGFSPSARATLGSAQEFNKHDSSIIDSDSTEQPSLVGYLKSRPDSFN